MDRASRKSTRSAAPLRAVPPPYGFFTVPKCVAPAAALSARLLPAPQHGGVGAALSQVALGAPWGAMLHQRGL